MEKRRSVWAGVLAVLLIMTVFFSGCSVEQVKELAQKAQNKTIEVALTATVDVLLDESLAKYEKVGPVADFLQEKVKLQVIDSRISANGVMATCVVSAPDITEFIENINVDDYLIDGTTLNEEKLVNDVLAQLKAAPVTQRTVTIGLEATESGYKPTDMKEFANAYTGGAMEKILEIWEEHKN